VSTSNNFALSVQSSGLVNNGTLQAGGQLSVTGSNNLAVSGTGTLAGAGTVQLTSNANTPTLSGSQFTAGDITVTANGSGGVIVVNSTPSTYTLKAGGNITFTSANTGAGTSVTNSGLVESTGGTVTVTSSVSGLSLGGGGTYKTDVANGTLTVSAPNGVLRF